MALAELQIGQQAHVGGQPDWPSVAGLRWAFPKRIEMADHDLELLPRFSVFLEKPLVG